jgi:hypothetical protein
VTDFVKQRRGVRHGCSLSPYLFNIFIDDDIDYISEGNVYVLVIELLFADDVAIRSFSVNRIERGIDQVTKYYSDWNLKCNLRMIKILVFKKGGKFKNEICFIYDQLIEVVNEISYLGLTLETAGGWKKQN